MKVGLGAEGLKGKREEEAGRGIRKGKRRKGSEHVRIRKEKGMLGRERGKEESQTRKLEERSERGREGKRERNRWRARNGSELRGEKRILGRGRREGEGGDGKKCQEEKERRIESNRNYIHERVRVKEEIKNT